jgi:hypothetical protein
MNATGTVWNVWEWEGGSWRVTAHFSSQAEARDHMKAMRQARGDALVALTRNGDTRDDHIRANCTYLRAPHNG